MKKSKLKKLIKNQYQRVELLKREIEDLKREIEAIKKRLPPLPNENPFED